MNKFNALKRTTQRLKRQTFTNCPSFKRAFSHLFHTDVRNFKYELSQNMNNLEKQLKNEILHEKDSKSTLSVIKVLFDKFIHSEMLKSFNYDSNVREARKDFKDYIKMEAQSFKDLIIQHMESIKQCIAERACHEQEIHNRLKRLNDRKLQIQECMVQKVKASDASSGEKDSGQGMNAMTKALLRMNTDIIPFYDTEQMVEVPYTAGYNVFAVDTQHYEQPECIINTCVVEKTEFERYKAFNDRTVNYDKLKRKLNETLGLLAQKEINIKEGLKLKAYEILVVKEKHDELVKHSLLTKSHYEGLVKEKTKVITDLKLKEEKDIDKMISMEKQLKFLYEIVYKRKQSNQTIHMLVPKGLTFNGRPTFANPVYLKMAQSEKPCLYEIPNDQSDPANKLVPDREETLTLEKESRSKLNKDLVRPYDYTKLNSLYVIFKPASKEYHEQLAHENKKLIEKMKGKSVDTNFEKQSILRKPPLQPIRNQPVIRQPTAYKSKRSQLPRHRIASQVGVSNDLTKPVTPHSWPQVRKSSFAKPYDVNTHDPSRKSPKHVSFQSPKESVVSNDMVHNYYLEEAKKKARLQKEKALNTKPGVQQSARLLNTTNGNKPKPMNFNQQPRNWPPSMSSRISNRTINITEPPRNQKTLLKSKDLACPTCKKCIYSANHNECILKYLSKTGLTWKPTGRIFTQVGLKWIPIRKLIETRYNRNGSASPLGKETHNPKTVICANSSSFSVGGSLL
uniref:Integrase, catalytic region, zinc finger, CCHC-type, peptidase aspartic, catalytic n=1 Tax=Tanacetum cinerariifolium TaxID=118510 RepID=A0A6L2MQL5_TANCI|nr:hypothetical protein [Tanacetum cinerariifolium]